MTAQQIATFLDMIMKSYYDRTTGENADLSAALWELAHDRGQAEAVRELLRNGRLRDYEAPANG